MYDEYDSTLFLERFFAPSALAAEVFAALAGALEAAGALLACEEGALEATVDLGAWASQRVRRQRRTRN